MESNHVWGRVYRIPPESAVEIWEYLDHREKDGYTMRTVDVRGIVDGEDVVIEKDVRSRHICPSNVVLIPPCSAECT